MSSGADEAAIIKSILSTSKFALLIAFFAALIPKSDEVISPEITLLCLIPVLVVIHSSDVSSIFVKSSFVTIFGATS